MGEVPNIGTTCFPKQSGWIRRRVRVLFYDDIHAPGLKGTIVRMDDEEPGKTIIHLDDGRFVLSTECMFALDEVGPTLAAAIGEDPSMLVSFRLPPLQEGVYDEKLVAVFEEPGVAGATVAAQRNLLRGQALLHPSFNFHLKGEGPWKVTVTKLRGEPS